MEKVVVSIADEFADDVPAVVESLRGAGLVVESVQESVGTVAGSIDHDAIRNLESLAQVAEVERERRYHLPPPDAEVQ